MKKIFSVLLFTIIFISKIFAQENIPYSRYGIGSLQPMQFQSTMGMGNLSTAFQSDWMQNPSNPASYASLADKSMVFDAALQMRWNTLNDGSNSATFFNMQPAYLGLGTMIKSGKKLRVGLGFSLLPYSKLSYNISQKSTSTDLPLVDKYAFTGSGATYKVQMATGVKYKNLSLGIQGGYMFGRLFYDSQVYYPDSSGTLGSEYYRIQNPGGFCWQGGLQYLIPLKKENKIVLGATYIGATTLRTSESEVWRRFNSTGGSYQYLVDTVKYISDTSGNMKIPSSFSVGVQWMNGRQWAVGAEFKQQDWSLFRNFNQADSLKKSWGLAVGGYFSPDPLSTQVLRKSIYKFGFNYGLDPIYLRNKQFNYYSFSGGVSIPFTFKAEENRPMLMFLHLNFETGSHGSTSSGLVNESFFRFNFGVTISGNWYQKRKFD